MIVASQGFLKLMCDKDLNRKARQVRKEKRFVFAFPRASSVICHTVLAYGASEQIRPV
jgi:hypothetical protein